ncbi:serine hydrolase [Fibrella sp. HMF5335]|uniref:Serine hydrolase n=1 Tax=Fibrella rubiginis TaxID=2817060 RepID=A0A939GEN5_9BACT|nr:serine hydrolase [Fibrella rubiginis]MBO0935162.1 serine hydrolase [Fibrella rubiginis]
MSTYPIRFTLLLVYWQLTIGSMTMAQPARKQADRITAVENSLLPYVPVAGLPGWNLLDRMRHYKVPGLSIAVIHNYQVDWVKGYGLADTTTHRAVTPQTLFSAGSISKLVAAMAALRLVEQDKLSLDAPINQYLTSWKLGDNGFTQQTPVTLRMLLSHRGGTSQSAYFGFTPDKQPLPSVPDILAGKPGTESRRVVVNSEPNKEFRYSGGGYLVAQMAMMDVTKQDFATLTNQLLFKPLGLTRTTFAQPLPPSLATQASWAYSTNGWFKGMPYVYPQQAAAGLYSTPADLARLVIDLQNSYRGKGGLLSQSSVKAMMTPLAVVSDGFINEQIGLGTFLLQQHGNTDERGRYFEHTGTNAGFVAYALGSLVGGNGVVVMLNDNNGANELGKEIRRAVAQAYGWTGFLPKPLVTKSLPDSLLNAYVGRYQRGADEVVSIRRSGNRLIERVNNGDDIICVPVGRDTIAFTDYTARAYFSRNKAGRVDSLRVEWQQTPMPRLPDGQYLPNELIRMGRIDDAVAGYRTMNMNVSQLTYLAYELAMSRPRNLPAAEGLLRLAQEQFPNESIVYASLGELYRLRGEKNRAIEAFRQCLKFDASDEEVRKKLIALEAN